MTLENLRRIAADSNVILSAVIGKSALKVFTKLQIEIITTQFNLAEVKEYIPCLASKYRLQEHLLLIQLNMLPIILYEETFYQSKIPQAKRYLSERDVDDIHLAALALKEKIPIWSNDRDFENLPLILYTTGRLLKLFKL